MSVPKLNFTGGAPALLFLPGFKITKEKSAAIDNFVGSFVKFKFANTDAANFASF